MASAANEEENERSLLLSDKNSCQNRSVAIVCSITSSTRNAQHFTGRNERIFATLLILLTEFCERLAFFGLVANLVLFCEDTLQLPSPWPSTIFLVFVGTCYLTTLLGGWLSDTYLGRYNTIFGFLLLYIIGAVLMLPVSYEDISYSKTARLLLFAAALTILAFATGGIKSNVSPFGADQNQQEGPRAVQTFFNWFYFFINLGSFLALTVVVWVQQTYSYFYGYVITASAVVLTVIIFVSGRNKYIHSPPAGSELTRAAKIIYEAITIPRMPSISTWLDKAKRKYGGTFTETEVEDVKSLLRVIPVFLLFVVYWAVYSQMSTTFLIQGTYMRLKFSSFSVPSASLAIFDVIAVLAMIPIMDHIVYPLLQRCGVSFTPLRRIGVGFLMAAAAMMVAGFVEITRRGLWEEGHVFNQLVNGENKTASDLNIFWQVPQYILIGSSEVLTSVTGLEFAYSQSPKNLKGVVMGSFMITFALGHYLTSLLVTIVRSASNSKWYPSNDLNKGKLEYFFFLLAGITVVTLAIFAFVASRYTYKKQPVRTQNKYLWVDGEDTQLTDSDD
ncbi:solute carrier family 15 member 4-like [Acropora millepora]|uniref:solute carrier family 15 member 4-like n=1 Tax=Acropora millepora TaxID=45264 RepID=UPI001CF1F2F0|nr:solute carrier family 15 member 4-like [Acropora millepora]